MPIFTIFVPIPLILPEIGVLEHDNHLPQLADLRRDEVGQTLMAGYVPQGVLEAFPLGPWVHAGCYEELWSAETEVQQF